MLSVNIADLKNNLSRYLSQVRDGEEIIVRGRDAALEPVADDEIETRELFQSEVARSYVARVQQIERIRSGEAGP